MPKEDSKTAAGGGMVGYHKDLMPKLIEMVNNSDVVKAQKENSEYDIFTGQKFSNGEAFDITKLTKEEIAALVKGSKDYYLFDVVKVEDDQNTTGHFLYLFGIDADEETSYWFQIEFDKSILEWERYMNRVQTNG